MTTGLLTGVKVLEHCQLVAGPYCAKLLADFGAETIKIEPPGGGDEARRRGPFLDDIPHAERSSLFLYLNTNKLGITLDTKSRKGKKIFEELVEQVDILVEDTSPGIMSQLGLDYDRLREVNPRLVMTSITPFGQTGPYRNYKAYHLNVFHSGGEGYVTPVTPVGKSLPNRPPLKVGKYTGDYRGGVSSAVATLGALYYSERTGVGQHIDVSKQHSLIPLLAHALSQYALDGRIATRQLRELRLGGVYRCKDGFVQMAIVNEREWQRLINVMGDPAWARDERFQDWATWTSRPELRPEVEQHVTEWLLQHTKEEVYHKGQAKRLPIAPCYTVAETMGWRQMRERGFFVACDHPEVGRVEYPSSPYRLSEAPVRIDRAAPLLGQHNEEIYGNRLGYSSQQIVKLREAGVI